MATEKPTSAAELEEHEHEEERDEEEEEEAEDEAAADSEDEDEDEEDEEDDRASHETVAKPAAPKTVQSGTSAWGSIRNTFTIAKRELRAYFDSLVAYVVIGLSMLGLGGYFFFYQGGFWQVDRATMMRLFDFAPGALCLVVPLVTMATLAEEKRSGTIELLITMPVKDSEVIMGKYLAAMGMCCILLLATLTYPIAMFWHPWTLGSLDWGPVWTGYLGLLLYCGASVGLGMMVSSFTESQIISFFVTALAMLTLWGLGFLVESVQGATGDILSFVSFQSRFQPFAHGLIDSRAVIYFLSIAVVCLLVSFRQLESRKWK